LARGRVGGEGEEVEYSRHYYRKIGRKNHTWSTYIDINGFSFLVAAWGRGRGRGQPNMLYITIVDSVIFSPLPPPSL
jgi:hypothetical protein